MSNPYREEFISIYTQNITREGSQKLLAWLDTTDFYTAPASTKFHCACESGLVMHSLNVYKAMRERWFERATVKKALRYVRCCTTCANRSFIRPPRAT